MITVHTVHPERGYTRSDTVTSLRAALADPRNVVWVDLYRPTHEEAAVMTSVLSFHPLTVEDVLVDHGLPKVEDFGDYLYTVVHGIGQDTRVATGFQLVELDLLLGDRFVLSHHHEPLDALSSVAEDLPRRAESLCKSPVRIFHAILDRLVDQFMPLMDQLDAEVEELEAEVMGASAREVMRRIIAFKRKLQALRRASTHQREILFRLGRGEFARIPADSVAYFRDVHDHFLRVTDLTEGYREVLTSVLDAYLSTTSNRLNEVMKFLTIISTVMLPLSFIAGVYGMNFHYMPELHWRYGYAFALGVMLLTAVGLIWYFRRKGWL